MDAGAYMSPTMTQQQLVELQARVQQAETRAQIFKVENQRLQEQLETETLVRSNPLNADIKQVTYWNSKKSTSSPHVYMNAITRTR